MGYLMSSISDSCFFEPQYSVLEKSREEYGLSNLGLMSSFTWNDDPKRLLFVLSRYKFVASLLRGCKTSIEIGCGDGFASRIVAQAIDSLTLTDLDPVLLENAKINSKAPFPANVLVHDFMKTATEIQYESAYLLDVLEHIDRAEEISFLSNIRKSVLPYGKVIIGMPSLESQVYASPASKEGHINCKSKEDFRTVLSSVFPSVTVFSMNDEVVHTGFGAMSHYLIGLCIA